MKILHIVEAFTGGVITYLQALVNGLDADCRSYIFYALRPETPPEPEKLFRAGTVLIPSKHLTREIRPRADAAALLEIREVVRAIQPDAVHLHSSKAGALGRWAINGARVPMFYTPHGYSFLMKDCPAAKARLYFLIEKLCGLRRCTTIACGQAEYEQSLRVTKRATRVDNGIDTEALDRLFPEAGSFGEGRGACTLGRIVPQKNPGLFNRIARAFPEERFVWIGDGEMRGALDSPNIEITGWLPKEEALARMRESKVFLLPSLWEGMAMSLLEAMYLRRVCVASDIPANACVLRDGSTGFLCGGLAAYVDALSAAFGGGVDPEIGERARREVAEKYSGAALAGRYAEIYRGR